MNGPTTSLNGRLQSWLPFLRWAGELRDQRVLVTDLIAGITVALVLVPQSMAYAQLAGLPPLNGLYASFLPVIVGALFGSSRQLATGPVAVVSLLTASALGPLVGGDPQAYLTYAVALALMVGLFQLTLGLLRLGVLVDFISHPVVIGFTNAAAIIIATSQLGTLLGVSVDRAPYQYETVWKTLMAIPQTHIPTLLTGLLAMGVMVAARRIDRRLPGVLIAVVVTTLLSWAAGFEHMGGKIVGHIPAGLPELHLPRFDSQMLVSLAGPTMAIALIGFMEAISIAKAMAARTRQRLDANQELVGQGLSNITAGLSHGYAVSGSISRSAVNFSCGAVTGFSSIVTWLVVTATLLWFTPLFYHLPQATLAAVIIMAVINLIAVEPLRHAWKVQRHDGVVALVTFVLTLIWAPHLDGAIIAGVLLGLGLHIFRTMRPRIVALGRTAGGAFLDAEEHDLKTCPYISVLRMEGPLFFANSGYFENMLLERVATKPRLKFVVVDCEAISDIDATGEQMLRETAMRLRVSNTEMLFARAKGKLQAAFIESAFIRQLGDERFFQTRAQALDYAWQRLGDGHAKTCALRVTTPGVREQRR